MGDYYPIQKVYSGPKYVKRMNATKLTMKEPVSMKMLKLSQDVGLPQIHY